MSVGTSRKNHPSRKKVRLERAIERFKSILAMDDESLKSYRLSCNKLASVEKADLDNYREELKKQIQRTEANLKKLG